MFWFYWLTSCERTVVIFWYFFKPLLGCSSWLQIEVQFCWRCLCSSSSTDERWRDFYQKTQFDFSEQHLNTSDLDWWESTPTPRSAFPLLFLRHPLYSSLSLQRVISLPPPLPYTHSFFISSLVGHDSHRVHTKKTGVWQHNLDWDLIPENHRTHSSTSHAPCRGCPAQSPH